MLSNHNLFCTKIKPEVQTDKGCYGSLGDLSRGWECSVDCAVCYYSEIMGGEFYRRLGII